jgi:DNA-binding transcriptional regulator LsrR (DeoR family)
LRDREIARLSTNDGKGIKGLALTFGLSQRTVQRALKRAKNEFTPKIKTFGDPNG